MYQQCSRAILCCRKSSAFCSQHYFSQMRPEIMKPLTSQLKDSINGHYLKKKFNDLVLWYEELTGMDEVRTMQNRVIEAQDRFAIAQEKRRNMSGELTKIQNKLKEMYAELESTSRGEERYLQLITQEHQILKEERRLTSEFSLVEREERDSFTYLSACVKESHEKERAQAERTKYWSIIGSIIGTIIGVAGSSINNEFKLRELRNLVKDVRLRSKEEGAALVAEIRSALSIPPATSKLEKDVEAQKNIFISARRSEEELEKLLQRHTHETRLLLAATSLVAILLPLVINWIQR